MDSYWRSAIWQQFVASIEMLENAIRACPDEIWNRRAHDPKNAVSPAGEFWYLAFHTLFWLDYYLCDSRETFAPPQPFTLSELDPDGAYPDRLYSQAELQTYLEHGRHRCRTAIARLTDEEARASCGVEWLAFSRAELLLYNMRHVQHHAAQLNMLLRQETGSAPGWVARTEGRLPIAPEPRLSES